MSNVQNSRTIQPVVTNASSSSTQVAADLDAAPLTEGPADKAATFERAQSKKSSLFAPHKGGDSRVVSPAGGGLGEVNQHEAIDGHSKKEGDFTEQRIVDGQALFFTPAGARAVDSWMERARDSSAPLRAESDPTRWEKFFKGDLFDGLEQFSGKTK